MGAILSVPPTFEAAMPVLAVTATASGVLAYFLLKEAMIAFRRRDFPVPRIELSNSMISI